MAARVLKVDETRVTVAEDPAGVLGQLLEILLADEGETLLQSLCAGVAKSIALSPTLVAEGVVGAPGRWDIRRASGENARIEAADMDRLFGQAYELRRMFRLERFPIGVTLDDQYPIVEHLRGTPDRGMYRARDRGGERMLLVTMGPPQSHTPAEFAAALSLPFLGVAPLRLFAEISTTPSYCAMLEEEPPGVPSSSRAVPFEEREAILIALSVALVMVAANSAQQGLGWVRPELVYVVGNSDLGGIAPRCERFLAHADPRGYGVPACFDNFYAAPELLASPLSRVSEAADVFSLCAMLAHWVSGEHPFLGEAADQVVSIAVGARRPWRGNQLVGALVDKGLRANATARPPLSTVIGLLEDLLELLSPGP